MDYTEQHGWIGGSSWSWLAGLFVFGVMLAGTGWLYRVLMADENAVFERHLENISTRIQSDFRTRAGDQLQIQERMASRLAHGEGTEEVAWRNDARILIEQYPYYRAMAVLEADLTVRWLETAGPTELVETRGFPADSETRQTALSAGSNGEFHISPAFRLPDDRIGITVFMPIDSGRNLRGFLASVLDMADVIAVMLGNLHPDEVEIRANVYGMPVYPLDGETAGAGTELRDSFMVDLDGDGRGVEFVVTLRPAAVSRLRTIRPQATLVTGILFSLLMATAVVLALGTIEQARVLALANRRLEDEMREREHAERELEFLATHDPLTGVPNRSGFSRHVTNLLDDARIGDHTLALMYIDLDNFKDVNDRLGHIAGDELLRLIADRLDILLGDGDFIGRHGGDEFVIAVLRNGRGEVEQLAGNILAGLNEGFDLEETRVSITASIGVAIHPEGGSSVNELIRNADAALFSAKHAGRNQYALFTRELFAQMEHRLKLGRDIHKALETGQFQLVYQPVFDLRDMAVCGLEALVRWQNESGDMVPPQEFIRIAEESGSIHRLSRHVLRRALADLAGWQQVTETPPWVAVNISGALFRQSGLVEQLNTLLDRQGVRPGLVHLEITEQVLIENLSFNRNMLQRLVEMGMHIVIDDFGVGFSTLSYLKNFPVSVVKIDRGFIRDLQTKQEDRIITRTICSLASDLGMTTIAEGIENEEQLVFLRKHGCRLGQGFLFARPISAEVVVDMLKGRRSWSELHAGSGEA